MELGGNKLAKAYYEKNGMLPTGGQPDHKNSALMRYKNELKMKAQKAVGAEPTPAVPLSTPLVNLQNNSFGTNNIVLKMDVALDD